MIVPWLASVKMPPDGARMLVEGFASYAPEILIIPGRGGVRQMLLTVSLCLAVVHVSVMVCAVPAISDAPNLRKACHWAGVCG